MKFIIKLLIEMVIISIIATILTITNPMNVDANSNMTLCPNYTLSPTISAQIGASFYDLSANSGVIRDCVHLLTKQNTYIKREPSITVLTHGLGGDPSHWENSNANNNTIYNDTSSLVERIRRLDDANTDVFVIQNRYYGIPSNYFTLKRLSIPYSDINTINPINLSSHNLSKKIVLIFSATDSFQSNLDDYDELDYFIDLFSYKY